MDFEIKTISKIARKQFPFIIDMSIDHVNNNRNYVNITIDLNTLKDYYDVDISHMRDTPFTTADISHIIDNDDYDDDIDDTIVSIANKVRKSEHIPSKLKSNKKLVIKSYTVV
jgi:uncharacterized protein YeeX (DUF496 family)